MQLYVLGSNLTATWKPQIHGKRWEEVRNSLSPALSVLKKPQSVSWKPAMRPAQEVVPGDHSLGSCLNHFALRASCNRLEATGAGKQ